ncbi:MAG: transpeptidase family protein [Deltaproteobacteria bacterium]|nr:transpeptidase family protein [Deltaproteobacteria bacterium]
MRAKKVKWMRLRIYITGICFFLAFIVVFLRAYQLQILEASHLSSLAARGYTGELTFTTQRGTIYDRHGEELALSVKVSSIYGYPKKIVNSGKAAAMLSRALSVDRAALLERLRSSRSFVWIKRKVTPEEIRRVEALGIPGIEFTEESRRYYPCVETVAHVVGFASQDNKGLEGIELQYNGYLEGREATLSRIHDALGRPLLFDGPTMERQGPFNLVLTLDKDISYKAQKSLRQAVERSGAVSGICIVMRPQTGEILAMAVVPEFNPNVFWLHKPYEWRNRAVTDCFEPGSTLKAFLLAAALQEGVVTPETVLDCERGEITVADYVIHDGKAYGRLPVSDIIKYSSNIGAIKIGRRLGAERFNEYLQRLGFGERSGIDFPGERRGPLKSMKHASVLDQNTLFFGQGLSVSPLQLTMAFGAIANGGRLMRPYLVKSILDQEGKTVREFYPHTRRKVISQETARKVEAILRGVVEKDGTAPRAAIQGYTVAGKTGTAQKVDPIEKTYSNKKYVAYFGGFAPSESPEIAILVALDEPKDTPYGGVVAAPVFRDVGGWTLNHLNVAPSVSTVLARRGLIVPAAYERGSGMEEKGPARGFDVPGLVPDVKGLGVREVLKKARVLGLRVIVKGSGLAVKQSPTAGLPVRSDTLLVVTFQPPC